MNITLNGNRAKVGDKVAVFFHNGNEQEVFNVQIGILTHLDDEEPFGTIDDKPVDFASEGHSSFIRVIESIEQ